MNWHEYERRKRALPQNLTCREYEEAIRKITEELEKAEKRTQNYKQRN